MTVDPNGRLKLSAGNWLGLFCLVLSIVVAIIGSHYKFAVAIHREVATIGALVKANAFRITTNDINIRENRSDIKQWSRNK